MVENSRDGRSDWRVTAPYPRTVRGGGDLSKHSHDLSDTAVVSLVPRRYSTVTLFARLRGLSMGRLSWSAA